MAFLETFSTAIRTIPDFPSPGILFKDITPALGDPVLLRQTAEALAEPFRDQGITKVVGVESRGFIFGGLLAERLHAGFVPVRKLGKLPAETIREDYQLEYGSNTIEMHLDAMGLGDRVLIHDDVLATGGTAAATCRLVRQTGARIVACSFLVEIGPLGGRARLGDLPVYTILST